jgi:endonuclease G
MDAEPSVGEIPNTRAENGVPREIHSLHCFESCPMGTPATNDVIFRHTYTMSTNDDTKFADWVAYVIDETTVGPGVKTNRNWKADPWLEENETLEPADYDGANAALGTSRGHQVPLASLQGTAYWSETNFLSNITPQQTDLNAGVWKRLEDLERDRVRTGLTLYVLTGPLYEREMEALPGADEPHRLPSGYWKIITETKDDRPLATTAYLFDQETPRSAILMDFEVSVPEVSSRTGLTFFAR